MGIFYNPPPPAGRTAVTPPEPHVPIGTQGTPPPRYTTVLMLAAVLASWPADLEPRLQRPNDQRVKIAPLTFTYGAQPPPIAPLAVAELTQIVSAWAVTWDAQTAPKNAAWNVPPIVAFVPHTTPPALIWSAWEPPFIRPQTLVSIAPLTLPSGNQPSPQPPLSTIELAQIVASWPPDVGPSFPWTKPPSIIGTFPTVTQPQPQAALSVLELAQTVGTWAQTWDAQTAAPNAAWNVPPLPSTFVPSAGWQTAIWTAWLEPDVRRPSPVNIAPTIPAPAPPTTGALRLILVDGHLAIHLSGILYERLD